MLDTSAVLPYKNINSISTLVLDPEANVRHIFPSPSLLPSLGNRVASFDNRQITRIESQEHIKEQKRSTKPAAANLKQLSSFKAMESWVGRVTEIDKKSGQFIAIVVSDLHSETRERAEFTFAEISEDDQLLVAPGAMFYWSVGYQINEYGGRMTASTLRFQRIRHWTRKELSLAKERSAGYSDWFTGGANGLTNAAAR